MKSISISDRIGASLKRRLDFWLGVPLLWLLSLTRRSRAGRQEGTSKPQRVLVIKLAAAGDAVLLVPVLRALRKALPHARVDWLVSPVNRVIAGTVPYVDEVIVWPKMSLWSLANLAQRLRKRSYDIVIDAEQWARGTALLAFLTGAPERVGFDTPGQHRSGLYTRVCRKSFSDHEINEFFRLFSSAVPLTVERSLELWDSQQGQAEVERWLGRGLLENGTSPTVLIHPGCGADGSPREWPIASYAELARWLQNSYGARVVLSSGPEETHKTAELNELLGGTALDVGGKLSWLGMISLVRSVDLVISGNTGVMHLAAASHTMQVALHGPTDPRLWGPLNPNALVVQSSCPKCPCLRLGFEYHRLDSSCMSKIEVEEVQAAVVQLLGGGRGQDRPIP